MPVLPRMTGALRAFSNVSAHETLVNDGSDLAKKKSLTKPAGDDYSWQDVSSVLLKNIPGHVAMKNEIVKELKTFQQTVITLVGSDSDSAALNASSVYIFLLFNKNNYVSSTVIQQLRTMFGVFDQKIVRQLCDLAGKILSWLDSDQDIEELLRTAVQLDKQDTCKEFGHGIKFAHSNGHALDGLNELTWLDSDSESDGSDREFDMRYIPPEEPVDTGYKNLKWLRQQVVKYSSSDSADLGMSIEDLSSTVFETLKSTREDSELQNDLFELLGFDRFELIQILLENRKELVDNVTTSAMLHARKKEYPRTRREDERPKYGSQVTIQSAEEIEMRKQMKKEGRQLKKMMKHEREEKQGSSKDWQSLGINPAQLRAERVDKEAALWQERQITSLKLGGEARTKLPKYPHVYDSYAEACQGSSFVAGTKMVLPQGFKRTSTKIAEEIDIPSSKPAPANIGGQLVPIASLDKVGQVAFQGCKTLNRIQSVVFEKAYTTNENLLICAPTGAGKTNIAMLTVVHEIKQHIEHGVIKTDDFKIVYIAPMKALAAEMVRNFGKRLEPLGISVKELTGDMQLTKTEIMKTQMLVTTPEKWDVVTRKSTGDVALTQIVRLLIIDEVHLLHDERGSVIESLVARTSRQVESSQSMIRIVGLSATLPNYIDVAKFLNVSPYNGLFFFDGRFRPVPLATKFIGVKSSSRLQQMNDMNKECYDKVLEQVRAGEQVMVFVHARNETVRTASVLAEMAKNKGEIGVFQATDDGKFHDAMKAVNKSRNKQMRELFGDGFSIHHAGMLRSDRNLVERSFSEGLVRCLVCTATLAWGVNLPAHAVVIKGTQIYDAKKGSFVDLGILDVMQIFGRAGRPQFDTFGLGTIITTHDKLSHYLSLLTRQNPIESQFVNSLVDNLNAEISLGTVTNVDEAVKWMSYTYLFVRMRKNPLAYGLDYSKIQEDPMLLDHRRDLIKKAGRALDKAKMIRFVERTGNLHSTDLGRTASHYYIKHDTVETFNTMFQPIMTEDKVFSMVAQSQEFEQIKVRDEELVELDHHNKESCAMAVSGGTENSYGKTNILLQTYISRARVENFSLVSDMAYVAQNSARIVRALFEMALRKGWPVVAGRLLQISKTIEKRLWGYENPLRQFDILSYEILNKIENRGLTVDYLKELDHKEIGRLVSHQRMGGIIKQCVEQIPELEIDANIQPVTRAVIRVQLHITAAFTWNDKVHGKVAETFWIWVEDPENNHIYHSEQFMMHKKHVYGKEVQHLVFTIPIFEPLPTQYYIRAVSDRWIGSETTHPISFQHLILPEVHPPHTELLALQPLPITALQNEKMESIYSFTHFNPIQTQVFHTLYHSDVNVLLGAPTGSGKTVAAELAIFRVFNESPDAKAVYIAPLKALVRERMEDWKVKIVGKLGKKVVELTGDVTPDMRAIAQADLIITTPEKWDGISRSWQTRGYVKAVTLIVIDEIHLLGDDRGPVLEVIVSRTNFISSHTTKKVRVVGLSTALANARDLADWLGIKQMGLFNFRPSVRPVPLEVHVSGFPGKHYCPRMATMNKPAYRDICTYSNSKPVLIFVSSRRQTRLTAIDLISFLAACDDPKKWLHMDEVAMENVIAGIKDINLKLTLAFGIGLHHAGLHERDRKVVEELFCNQRIQILIATSTLAWGVNFPAHLVIVKGTEYFDGKTRRYVDFPITDVLQMMGRAGRPQFDDQAVAVIFVHDVKKPFYKRFLYEPFPVESNLLEVLPEHLNAEIVAGTISSKQEAMDYLTWTYFFRRLLMNPSFYHLEDTDHDQINVYLSRLVENAVMCLKTSNCLDVAEDGMGLTASTLGRIASYYYLHYTTLRMFTANMTANSTIENLLMILSDAHEYAQLPVRHNEDQLNSELAAKLPLPVNTHTMDNSNTKTHLLLQAHFSQLPLPSSDYNTDTKSVMDQAIRILQAMLDVSADQGWLVTCLRIMNLMQMVLQAHWSTDNSLLMLPHVRQSHLQMLSSGPTAVHCLPQLMHLHQEKCSKFHSLLKNDFQPEQIKQIGNSLSLLPMLMMESKIKGCWEGGPPQETKPLKLCTPSKSGGDVTYTEVHADQEYVLSIHIARLNRERRKNSQALTPRFPKPKDECWFLVLGEVETQELIAMKRIPYIRQHANISLAFFTPMDTGRCTYTLYLMSDSYIGLDQQFDINFDVTPASIESQVNSELDDTNDSRGN